MNQRGRQFRAHCDRYQTRSTILEDLPGAVPDENFLQRICTRRDRRGMLAAAAVGLAAMGCL